MNATVKTFARGVATLLVVPALLSYRIRASIVGANRALEGSAQALGCIPGITGEYLRRAFLSRVLAHCHETVTIGFGTLFSQAGASLDEQVYIGPGCHLGLVHIERHALLASGVQIPSGAMTHGSRDLDRPIREQPGRLTMVRIGEGAWIGAGAIVMADVGRDTIVGAGAVVTSALPDRVVAGGVPARVLKARS
jgi:acetyltransferase-like isoleucine patch superfamily enzyme